ncbi:hypothetical protein [Hansschlegelia sp. KR7-227]|uniref:hypothetical protein n=1 Tax=Hansschlegelia sp. KR7-227 TaxID=3400914 RepID=UPI003BFB7C34
MTPLDAAAIPTVRRMVDAGMTHHAIAAALGQPEWRVAAFCALHGIRSARGRKLPAWSQLAAEIDADGQGAVAARYGVSTSAISQARRKAARSVVATDA